MFVLTSLHLLHPQTCYPFSSYLQSSVSHYKCIIFVAAPFSRMSQGYIKWTSVKHPEWTLIQWLDTINSGWVDASQVFELGLPLLFMWEMINKLKERCDVNSCSIWLFFVTSISGLQMTSSAHLHLNKGRFTAFYSLTFLSGERTVQSLVYIIWSPRFSTYVQRWPAAGRKGSIPQALLSAGWGGRWRSSR